MQKITQYFRKARSTRFLTLAAILLLLAAYQTSTQARVGQSACAQTHFENIQTDSTHYLAGETVTVKGTGFAPNCPVRMVTNLPEDVTSEGMATSDSSGNLNYTYVLGQAKGDYSIQAVTSEDVSLATAQFSNGPYIVSDKSEYLPGMTAIFSGRGFQPGETVSLVVHQVYPGIKVDRSFATIATESGAFSNSDLRLAADDLGTTLSVTATGLSSGRSAETMFSDSSLAMEQKKSNQTSATTVTSLTVTYNTAPTAGQLLVAIVSTFVPNTISMSSAGWSTAINEVGNATSPSQAIFYKLAGAGESTSVVAAFNAATTATITIYEYSGVLAAGDPLNGTGSNTGTGVSPSTGTVTQVTPSTTDLLIGGISAESTGSTLAMTAPTNGFLIEAPISTVNTGSSGVQRVALQSSDKKSSPAGSSTGFTIGTGSVLGWRGQIVAFKAKADATTGITVAPASPSVFGQPVTLTATITPNNATGNVTFKDGSTILCASQPVTLGIATCITSSLSVATHSGITAVYNGDASLSPSSSQTLANYIVNKSPTTTVLSSSQNTTMVGQQVTFKAVVSGNSPSEAIPAGNVAFKDGATTIPGCGTQALVAGAATCTTTSLSAASHSITAVYAGSLSFVTSTSNAVSHIVNQPSCPITVDGIGSPTTYKTIQEAVDALPAVGPCTINVLPGTYNEAVTVRGVNSTATQETQGIIIQASGSGVVVNSGSPINQGFSGFTVGTSKFVTVRGFEITNSPRDAIVLSGGSASNTNITIDSNLIHDNGTAVNGGIGISTTNQNTWIVNNLIRNSGQDGVSLASGSGNNYLVNNTIVQNGWNGVTRAATSVTFLINNLIVANGTESGTTGGRYGLAQSSAGTADSITLINNVFYKNTTGDMQTPAQQIDATDSGNRTTAGPAGVGIVGCTFADCLNTHSLDQIFVNSSAKDFHLSSTSPAIDNGVNTYGSPERVSGTDFEGTARPQGANVDVGYDETAPLTVDQTITVNSHAPANATYGTTFNVSATASSGLPVTITATGVCSLESGGTGSATIKITSGTGTCDVHYNQAGNSGFNPAPELNESTAAQKAVASVTPNAASKTYGDADPGFTGTLSGFLVADNVSATYSRAAGESVTGGPYAISATLSPAGVLSNYAITYNTANFTINTKTASVTPNAASKTYGDSDPGFTGTLSGFVVADNVSATYNRAAGESVTGGPYAISATLSPAGVLTNYAITYNTANFTINTKTASVTPNAASKTYGDADPELTGTLTGFVEADAVTPTYSRVAGETVAGGPYTISAVLSPAGVLANYDVTYNTAMFTVKVKAVSVTPTAASKTYGSADPGLAGTLAGFVDADGVTATYSRVAGETVADGPYTISATLSPAAVLGNYDITYNTANFTIDKKAASVTPTAAGKTYGDPDPSLIGALSGFLDADAVTATYSRVAGETVAGGPYAISATLSPAAVLGNYAITYNTAPFTIGKKDASVAPNASSKLFGTPDPTPLTIGVLTGFLPSDGVAANYTRTAGEAPGQYPVSSVLGPYAVLGNYNITYGSALFTIIPDADIDGIPDALDCAPNLFTNRAVDPAGVLAAYLPAARRHNTLQEAVTAAANGDVISMYADTKENVVIGNTTNSGGKDLRIVGCGHKITGAVATKPVLTVEVTAGANNNTTGNGEGDIHIEDVDVLKGSIGFFIQTSTGSTNKTRTLLKSIRSDSNVTGIKIGESGKPVNGNTVRGANSIGSNTGDGIQAFGNSNELNSNRVTSNTLDAIDVSGDSNTITKNKVGDKGTGSQGNGIVVTGANNTIDENDVFDSGLLGIKVTGNANQAYKNQVGDKDKGNKGGGVLITGDSNLLGKEASQNDVYANIGTGIAIVGNGNQLSKNDVGDTGKGNTGDGISVKGNGNIIDQNDVFANGKQSGSTFTGDGINISGGTSAKPNLITKNKVGDKGKGNLGNGIVVAGVGNGTASPNEIEENTVKGNKGIGISVTGSGHQLKDNTSGGTSAQSSGGDKNGGCAFSVATGNLNATGNKANGTSIVGAMNSAFPTACQGTP